MSVKVPSSASRPRRGRERGRERTDEAPRRTTRLLAAFLLARRIAPTATRGTSSRLTPAATPPAILTTAAPVGTADGQDGGEPAADVRQRIAQQTDHLALGVDI